MGGTAASGPVRPAASANAARRAATNSAPVANLCAGSLARARANTASSSGGTSARRDTDGMGAFTCAAASAVGLSEAYAKYNLAYTRFQLGNCDGVLDLLDQAEAIEGRKGPIDRLRSQAEDNC